jgi:hypothetical protein
MMGYDECGAVGGKTGKSNRSTQRKPAPVPALSTTNPTYPDPNSNPGRRSSKPATNSLNYGMAEIMSNMYTIDCRDLAVL